MPSIPETLTHALWRVYNRPPRPLPFSFGGNLPWDEPEFSCRMLREHLDEAHGAASRQTRERALQIPWLWQKLGLQSNNHLFDVTCGPGLYAVAFAQRGIRVTAVDFAPASIAYAQELAARHQVQHLCDFQQVDIREMAFAQANFDAAILLYGQLAVMTKSEAKDVLRRIFAALKPGGKLCIELLNQSTVDKTESTWWYSDDSGLWGGAPYLHFGERFWDEETAVSTERFHILHLESGQLDEILLCDQTYAVDDMIEMMRMVGFTAVEHFPAWAGLPLYDADEWIIYLGEKRRE